MLRFLLGLALEMGDLSRFLLKVALEQGNMLRFLLGLMLQMKNQFCLLIAGLRELMKTRRKLSGRVVSIEQVPGLGAITKILEHAKAEYRERSIRADRN